MTLEEILEICKMRGTAVLFDFERGEIKMYQSKIHDNAICEKYPNAEQYYYHKYVGTLRDGDLCACVVHNLISFENYIGKNSKAYSDHLKKWESKIVEVSDEQ